MLYWYKSTHNDACTTIYVSSYCCICVLILLYMCPHTTIYASSYYHICFLILLYLCPHTTIYVSSYYYICVLILVYMCSHTTMYVSSYCYVCVLILLCMCPHTTMYVSSYYYTCATSPCLAPSSISLLWTSFTTQFTCFSSTKVQILTQPLTVPGTVINQFAMDEFKGQFRVATTYGQMCAFIEP